MVFVVYERINIFVLRLKSWCLYEHYLKSYTQIFVHCAFFNGTVQCYNIKLSMSVLFCKKTNVQPGRLYEETLQVGSFWRKHVLNHFKDTSGFVSFCQNVGWQSIIQFYDLFLRTEYHSGLNLLLGNNLHLLFIVSQTSSIGFK